MMLVSGCSTSSPESVVQGYREAFNSHNIDSLMRYYADDVVFEVAGLGMSLTGRESVRGVAEYDSVLNTIMSLSNMTVSGDSVFCELSETNDWLNAAGISQAYYSRAVFVVPGSEISYIEAELSDSSAARINGVLDSLISWADQYCPERLEEMMPLGAFVYNADNAANSLDLLMEWRLESESDKEIE
jgi:ketosteroid isomerase-like protein